ncbi:MAG: ATP-binding protein [Desulfobaccales bacterium]
MVPAKYSAKIPWPPVLIFLFLSAGILAVGYLYYERQADHFRHQMEVELKAIADMQVKQIEFWRNERLHDAESVFNDPIFAREVHDWLNGQGAAGKKEKIINRMQGLEFNVFKRIRLLDSKGDTRLSLPETNQEVAPFIKEMASQAVTKHKIIFTDLYRGPDQGIQLDILAPINYHKAGNIINVGVIVLEDDPRQYLYSLLETWPTADTTAEFALFRREGEEMVFLNDLRHRPHSALKLRIPVSNRGTLQGRPDSIKENIVHELDYRGVPVLAATRKVPESPWFIMAKIDLEEVYAPLRQQSYQTGLLLIALIASSGSGIAYFWQNRDVLYYRQQYEAARQRQDLAQRYEYLCKNANDIILLLDKDLKVIEANDRALLAYGYSPKEFLSLHLEDLSVQDKVPPGQAQVMEREMQDGPTYEAVHKRKDGTTFPVAITSSAMEIDGHKLYQQIIRDMTSSKKREEALLQSKEQLRQLSGQLLVAQENERHRISQELHDDLGQALMVVKFQVDSIFSSFSKEKEMQDKFEPLLSNLDGLIEKVRTMSWDLSLVSLEQFGLSTAIEHLFDDFLEHFEIHWLPEEIREIDGLFPPLAQVNIYRIFQESLTNISRHAQASHVSVSIKKHDDQISFTVSDNGMGFDLQKLQTSKKPGHSIGLTSMQERAQLLGGSLVIWSQPGAGTKITLTIPMEKGGLELGTLSNPSG